MKVASIQIVTSFSEDRQVLFSLGQELLALVNKFGGKLSHLNVPDIAPPEVPRAIIQGKDAVISLGLNRLETTTRPPDHINSNLESSIGYAEKIASAAIDLIVPKVKSYLWTGIVIDVEYPQKNANIPAIERVIPVFDRLVSVDRRDRKLSTFQLQIGFNHDGIVKIFTIQGYENREILIEAGKNVKNISLDISNQPIKESGVQIITDINDKASELHGTAAKDLKKIISEHVAANKTLLKDLNLEGTIEQ